MSDSLTELIDLGAMLRQNASQTQFQLQQVNR